MVGVLTVVAVVRSGAATCIGDCDGNGSVSIGEILTGVTIALGTTTVEACSGLDSNGDGRVTITELVGAVGAALHGCARFPMGAYFWPDHAYGEIGSALGDLAAFGLNTVVAYYEYVKPDVPPFSGQPDCHGLVRDAPLGRVWRPVADSEGAQRLAATVACVGISPHYQGWMFDEPELTGYDPALLEHVVGLLRAADPHHRVWVNFNPFATDDQVRGFAALASIVGFDIYPISEQIPRPLTAVGTYTQRMRDLAAPDVPVWLLGPSQRRWAGAAAAAARAALHGL
jgi:hypothetical protein